MPVLDRPAEVQDWPGYMEGKGSDLELKEGQGRDAVAGGPQVGGSGHKLHSQRIILVKYCSSHFICPQVQKELDGLEEDLRALGGRPGRM